MVIGRQGGGGDDGTDCSGWRNQPVGHDRRYAIDAHKITTELGCIHEETFETGIRKSIQWYLDNERWWRDVMDGCYMEWINQNY